MTADLAEFRRWLLLERRHKPITATRVLQRIRFAQAYGFDLDAFTTSPDLAHAAGEVYLEKRLEDGSIHAYNNDVKWINNLAQFCGHKDVRFRFRREPPTTPRALTDDRRLQLLAWTHGDVEVNRLWRAIVSLEDQAGLRPSELAALDVEDLDVEASRLYVRKPAKGGRRRWLPMPPWLWSKRRPVGAYLRWRRDVAPGGPLWIPSNGDPRRLDQDYLRRIFYKIGKEIGFTVSCNVLRHTVAVRLRRTGHRLEFLKAWLGHANLSSTEVYAEYLPEDVEREFRARPAKDPFHVRQRKRR